MQNQHEIINNNLVKVIGIVILMLLLIIAFFSDSQDTKSILGIPNNQIENTQAPQ